MKTFLEDIAEELLKGGGNDFSKTCIVLPNKRAGVFLRDAISRQSNKAIWAPTVLSIEDFVFSLSDVVKADQTTLLFSFYEVYRQSVSDPQTIELFANWAPTFLSDVNELDLNLIDAEDIFAQLYSVERIARWNPETGQPTDFQQKHLDFVKQLFPYYKQLRAVLTSRKVGYQGMAFRSVAENAEKVIATSEWEHVWFAGFNALTISEEQILNAWQQSGKGKLFWDVDAYYADDAVHEAGHYIRRYANDHSDLKIGKEYNWKANRLATDEKEVHLIGVQRTMAQAQVAGSILKSKLKTATDGILANTAVILNDEQLLIPLLSSIPTDLNGINITMGYGLVQSQSAVLIEKLFKLYIKFAEQGNRFYLEDVLAIKEDAFCRLVGAEAFGNFNVGDKLVYLKEEHLNGSTLGKLLFSEELSSVVGFLTGLKRIIAHVGAKLSANNSDSLEQEFLFLLDGLAQRLLDLNAEFGGIDSIKTLHSFWKQLLRHQQLDFVGEPLNGLQVMGMLETRNLDFEEVIMLGVNEGNLPSSSHSNSYFTFDIRRAYGLACQNERDAVTAYHFYRLLQRAKKVYLVYDQDTDSLGRGEVSRYVRQLMMERKPNITLREWRLEQEIPPNVFSPEITIQKTEDAYGKIVAQAERGFSPSALNTFRSCSLKYYFRYVAEIREQDQFAQSIDHAKFGTAVHDTLEELYKPYLNKPVSEEILKEMKAQAKAVLETKFAEQLPSGGELVGKNLLAFEVAKTYVVKTLNHDIRTIRSGQLITPLQLEEELSGTVSVRVNGEELSANLKGKADRIDRLSNGTIRLIDYKSGDFVLKKTAVKFLDEFNTTKADHAFQLLTYLVMYSNQQSRHCEERGNLTIQPTVFYLRSQKVEFPITVQREKTNLLGSELLDYATERVTEVLSSLFDKSAPFAQTEDQTVCAYCDFNQVCQR
ncbi:MAG: PD-(D/E)XK nuclease family protein [Flavobacteriales bacterium]|nr:PD-(D/E)XK nuclease family protein [Flavobacteriales bacterium]